MNFNAKNISRIFQGLLVAALMSGTGCMDEDAQAPEKVVDPQAAQAVGDIAVQAALETNPDMPEDLAALDQETLVAAYEQTQRACGEIHSICVGGGESEEKCVQIEVACLEGSEAILQGEQTRAGLLHLLAELVTDILGVGPLAVDLVRCVSRFLACALTLDLTCAVDLVECVVDDVLI